MSRLLTHTLLLLLTTPVQLCLGWQVYITSTDLETYFVGTSHFDSIQGRQVDIIRDQESRVTNNGSLVLASASGASQGLLPALPREVDQVTITWAANSTEVDYMLTIPMQDPDGFFASPLPNIPSISTTGAAPSERSVFTLNVTCGAESSGEGDLSVDLILMDNVTSVRAIFVITKDCGEPQPSSSVVSPTPMLSDQTHSAIFTPAMSPSVASIITGAAGTRTTVHSPAIVSSESPTVVTQANTAGLGSGPPSPSTIEMSSGSRLPSISPSPLSLLTTSSASLLSTMSQSITAIDTTSETVQPQSTTLQPLQTSTLTLLTPSSSGFPVVLSRLSSPSASSQSTLTNTPVSTENQPLSTPSLSPTESVFFLMESSLPSLTPSSFLPTPSSISTLSPSSSLASSLLTVSLSSTMAVTASSQTPSVVFSPTPLSSTPIMLMSSSSLVATLVVSPSPSSSTPVVSPSSSTPVVSLSSSTPVVSLSSSTPVVSPSSSTPVVSPSSSTPVVSPSSSMPVVLPSSSTPVVSPSSSMPVVLPSSSTPVVSLSSSTLVVSPSSSTPVVSPSSSTLVVSPSSSMPVVLPSSSMPVVSLSSSTPVVSPSSSTLVVSPSSSTPVVLPSSSTPVVSPSNSTLVVSPSSSTPVVSPSSSTLVVSPSSSMPVVLPSSSTPVVSPSSSMPVVLPSSSTLVVSPSSSTPVVSLSSSMPMVSPSSSTLVVSPSSSAPVVLPSSSTPVVLPSSSTLVVSPSSSAPVVSPSSSAPVVSLSSSTPVILPSSSTLVVSLSSSTLVVSPSSSTPVVSPSSSTLVVSLSSSTLVVSPSSSTPVVLPSSSTPVVSSTPSLSTVSRFGTSPPSSPSTSYLLPSQSSSSVLPSVSPLNNLNHTGIPNKEPELGMLLAIAFAPVAGILLICIVVISCFIVCICCKKKKATKHFSDDPADLPVPIYTSDAPLGGPLDLEESMKKPEAPISLWKDLQWGQVSILPQSVLTVIKPYSVDRRALSTISTLCRGEFGCIVNGQLSVDRTDLVDGHKGVMIKMLIGFTQQNGHHNDIAKFLEQATLLHGLDHPNVAAVMKVSVEDNLVPLVLYPIVEYGNLHTFLTFCRVSPTESPLNPVTLQYKVNFGLQIAYAMKFLSEKGVAHPDLALRNCLLDTNYLVKVSDSALSQEFFPECYYAIKGSVRPVRWAALETLQEGLCTIQSNVWSYAVTLWEILTLAEVPYVEVDNNRSIPSHLMMGARLDRPQLCPDYLYELMQACWNQKAENRPNFAYLHGRMEEINEQLVAQNDSPSSIDSHHLAVPDPTSYSRENSYDSSLQSRRRRSGRNSFSKSSPAMRRKSTLSRVSGTGSEHLSLTFSVLSADIGSGSSSEGEDGPEGLSPLPESVVYQMVPSLLKEDQEDVTAGTSNVEHLPTSSPMNLVTSFLDSSCSKNSMELENSSKYTPFQSNFISPVPATPSTVTTRLTPCETTSYTSSQFGPSTTRSDDSANTPLPTSSPSPDLTSKSSMFGEDMSSNPRSSFISHSNTDTASKASGNESVGIATPGPDSSQPYSFHNTDAYTRSNGHGNLSQEQPVMNGTVSDHALERTDKVGDSNGMSTTGRDGYTNREQPLKPLSDTNGTTFGDLGLSDLSNDLMATFDSWDT